MAEQGEKQSKAQSSAHDARGTLAPASASLDNAPDTEHLAPPSRGSETDGGRPVPENISQLSPYQRSRLPIKRPLTEEWRLSPMQLAFVGHYIGEAKFNATEACRLAGYAKPGSARSLMMQPKIHRAIQAAMDQRAKRVELSADRVVQEIMKIAFIDPADLFDEITGEMKKMHDIPEDARRAIAAMEIESTKFGLKKTMKLTDKLKALELLGRHLKLFKDQLEVTVTFEAMVLASMEEVKKHGAASEIVEVTSK